MVGLSTDHLDLDADVIGKLLQQAAQEQLEPMGPEEALDRYLENLEDEYVISTVYVHRSRLSFFVEWCLDNGVENLNDLTGRDLQEFRAWRKDQLDSTRALETNLRTLRQFLRKCVNYEAVHPTLPDKVDIPSVSSGDTARSEYIDSAVANEILDLLEKWCYAEQEHVFWLLITDAGLRISAVYSLDVEDYERKSDCAVLNLQHRPETGTRLKNKSDSERLVKVSEPAASVIDDYLDRVRPDVTDDEGRSPLLASKHGRLHKTTMRRYAYKWTRPCVRGDECPEGLDPEDYDDCDAHQAATYAYQCPGAQSPHTVRRGYLTEELDAGVPISVLAERCDVSEEIIQAHYDERDEESRLRLRSELMDAVYRDNDKSKYAQD